MQELYATVDNFSNAQKKCEKAKCQSDLSSAEDNFKRKSYKILKKQKTPSSESDYEQSDDNSNSITHYHSDPDSSNKKLAGWSPLKTSINRGEIDETMSPIMVLDKPDKIPHTSTNNIAASKILIETTKSPIIEKNSYGKTSVSPTINSSLQSYVTFLLTDNTFKKSVIHQLLTLKYEMRSMDEKINIILKLAEDEKISSISQETATFSQFSQFDNESPIKTYDELIEIESKIASDKTYRSYFVQRLSYVGGKSIAAMVIRIMTMVFNPELLITFSYNGRCNKERNFADLLINKIIFESVFKIKKFAASDNSTNQIEQVIKYVLIQTPFKLKRQKETTMYTTVMKQT
ncbi:hypothetical protein ACI65C_013110 [Semiaphis heraclei]